MKLGNAIYLWNLSCHPPIGVADDEEVCIPTTLSGAAMALDVPTYVPGGAPKYNADARKKVADFLRQWADDIEGGGE